MDLRYRASEWNLIIFRFLSLYICTLCSLACVQILIRNALHDLLGKNVPGVGLLAGNIFPSALLLLLFKKICCY